MTNTIRTRLQRLEQSRRAHNASALEQILSAALQAISDEDLATLRDLNSGGVRLEEFTPEQRAFLGRFGAECEAVAMTLFGRRLAELGRITDARSSLAAVPPMRWHRRSRRSMRSPIEKQYIFDAV